MFLELLIKNKSNVLVKINLTLVVSGSPSRKNIAHMIATTRVFRFPSVLGNASIIPLENVSNIPNCKDDRLTSEKVIV